jgi:hypothetical protein
VFNLTTYTSGAPDVNPDCSQVQSLSTIVVVDELFSTAGAIQYVKGGAVTIRLPYDTIRIAIQGSWYDTLWYDTF